MISSSASDPSLSNGWAYFVKDENYKEFLNDYGKIIDQEVRRRKVKSTIANQLYYLDQQVLQSQCS